ncbi:MerR family transcriptional regulator [Tomitella fengzijianii]|uniref:MerR family transcriptional regulator n=1 Tax=Tomitella fengzijianii TaxID=2597660 RepID=A0A516X5G7_9ACTN|nr:MerR family transcriptional regulator [Tomitella fengzijianii]QDQ98328.1 MerR family transcriptional regulator [Tomitella fengzijianii]
MLTIGQLAAHAGVTVRAVRHYHRLGLLPEPPRDHSGYRRYDARAVVDLIRIRTLAGAGVPLAKVPDLLHATPADFSAAVARIDDRLCAQIRRLENNRTTIARLAAGDSLALPDSAVSYLAMLRAQGVPESMVEVERDSWIILAAKWPDRLDAWIADKRRSFDDPRMLRLYRLLDLDGITAEDPRLAEAADLLVALSEAYDPAEQPDELTEQALVELLDSFADRYGPIADRMQELLAQRGWTGLSNMQRTGR